MYKTANFKHTRATTVIKQNRTYIQQLKTEDRKDGTDIRAVTLPDCARNAYTTHDG